LLHNDAFANSLKVLSEINAALFFFYNQNEIKSVKMKLSLISGQ